MTEFENQLRNLINLHSLENDSDTPDHLLASFLREQLNVWKTSVRARDAWYNFEPWKGEN